MLFLDIETYSTTPIEAGAYRYSEDPAFEILMCAWATDTDPEVRLAVGEDEIRSIPGLLDPDVSIVAHNAQFERVCLSRLLPGGGFLPPERFVDTMALAAEAGYPQSLDRLAKALGGAQKDSAGTRLINLFCKPARGGQRVFPADRPEEWEAFCLYCLQDVETLLSVYRQLPPFPTPLEQRLYHVDQHINDNGLRVDRELAERAVAVSGENAGFAVDEFQLLTGVENPNSVQQVMAWLEEEGHPLPNLQKATVEEALARPLPPAVARALELRQDLALVSGKKFLAALNAMNADGRLRGTLRFHGAHTGRWSGRGVQPQNLPREQLDDPEPAIAHLKAGGTVDSSTLKALVRAMFVGPFTVVDYAAIEARVLAWLAGEEWALEAFRAGRDIYVETAERMGGLTRSQGKVAVLALGYNGSVGSLRAMGAEGTDAELLTLVRQWRRSNLHIIDLWRTMERAFRHGGPVGEYLSIEKKGDSRTLVLPSGRRISYHKVEFDADGGASYLEAPRRIGTYGGRLVENATQAVARDILAEALVRLHDGGYRIASHVHDEILVEGEHSVDEISSLMCEQPEWAPGLPISAEGFTTPRYRKG